MEQRPRVLRDIVFTCVVLHNSLGTQQGGAERTANTGKDAAAKTDRTGGVYAQWELQESFEGGQTATRTTERLLQSCGGIGWEGGAQITFHPWPNAI